MEPNLSINPPKAGEESLGIRTPTESTTNSSIETKALRRELKRKNEELQRKDEELKRTKWQLKDIAERNKVFYQINLLPKELKHMIYAQISMFDRVAAAKASREMEQYFIKNPLSGYNSIYLKEENGQHYVKVVYKVTGYRCDIVNYAEMHRIPDQLLPRIQNELESTVGCKCQFCRDRLRGGRGDRDGGVRYFPDGNLQEVFHSMRLFSTSEVELKSSPVGGLVDLLQPIGELAAQAYSVSGRIDWHPKKSDYHIRNDPRLNMGNWLKWFEYWSFAEFYFFHNNREVSVHRDMFDLTLVKNAREVHSACQADVNFRQIIQMKGYSLRFDASLDCVTPMDMLEIYKTRIKGWMKGEIDVLHYEFECTENPDNPPHLDYRKLFEDVKEDLHPDHFRLYANSLFWYSVFDEGKEESITIRNMKTNECLGVTANRLSSGEVYWKDADEFPDYLRF